jgi:hypothetical protein
MTTRNRRLLLYGSVAEAEPEPPAGEDVTFDAASSGAVVAAATSLTFALTVGAGTNRKLFVGVSKLLDTGTITGITYNSDPLTFIASEGDATSNVHLWYMDAPDSGAANVVVTVDNASVMTAGAIAFSGAAAGAPGTTDSLASDGEAFDSGLIGLETTSYGGVVVAAMPVPTSATAQFDATERYDDDGTALGILAWGASITGTMDPDEFGVPFGAEWTGESDFAWIASIIDPA